MAPRHPKYFELDDIDDRPRHRKQQSTDDGFSDNELTDIDDFDPLQNSERPYKDDASQPLRSVFDQEKKSSVLREPMRWLRSNQTRARQHWYLPSRCCGILVSLFLATLVLLFSAGGIWVYKFSAPGDGQSDPWYPAPRGGTVEPWQKSYEKAAVLVDQMTLVEKVNITTGTGWSMGMCVGNTGEVNRLGFPSLCLQDGPLGMRFVDNGTAFPAGITVGATWNKELMYQRGKAHGFEARLKGINVLLGPAMGPLGHLPAGGRNWEGFGSDPVLQGIAAAQTIRGIQDSGVIATAKHFVGNEQEHFRQSWEWGTPNAISSNIDDRTLHEIYAWPFADSVRAGVGSVMCSYNQVNNSYACQNSKLLNGVLKDELGFQGFVQSDWLAQRSGVAAALAGLDMSMPGDGLRWQDGQALWGSELTKSVLNGSVPASRLNDMTLRIVAAWYQLGQDDGKLWPNVTLNGSPNFSSWTKDKIGELHPGSPDSNETAVVNQFVLVRNTTDGGDHDALARKIAAEGVVLLKNEKGILPLSRNGRNGAARDGAVGRMRIGIFGEDAFANPKGDNACPDRGCNDGTLAMGWGSGSVDLPYLVTPAAALSAQFDNRSVELTSVTKNDDNKVVQTAGEQDLCIVFINSDAGEGYLSWSNIRGDRNNLFSQKGGDKLVQDVAAHCGASLSSGDVETNTIVILHTVGPTILERWIDLPGVKAVLVAHLPGQESGNAIADILFGDVNPSGRLPYTIARSEDDYGPSSKILRIPNAIVPQQNFTEGLFIDYRYFDKHQVEPRFEFGYGLSYTKFELSRLSVKPTGKLGLFPQPRPSTLQPPQTDETIPDAGSALWPSNFRKLGKYIYPYIDHESDGDAKQPLRFPDGYGIVREPSQAGGAQGGNPDLFTTAVMVQATLANTGARAGACVVQVYISYPAGATDPEGQPVEMPVRVLRGFEKYLVASNLREAGADLTAAAATTVQFNLTRRDLSYWDVKHQNWVLPQGEFTVHVGFSSRDLPLQATFST